MNYLSNSRRTRSISIAFACVGLLGLLVACTSNPSAGEAIDKIAPVVCDKAKECFSDEVFTKGFGDRDGCIKKASEGIKDRDAVSACDDAELDKCLSDLKATACPADGTLPKAPCDC